MEENPKEVIQKLLAKGALARAFELLIRTTDEGPSEAAVALSARYHLLLEQEHKGTLSSDEKDRAYEKLIDETLRYLSTGERGTSDIPSDQKPDTLRSNQIQITGNDNISLQDIQSSQINIQIERKNK